VAAGPQARQDAAHAAVQLGLGHVPGHYGHPLEPGPCLSHHWHPRWMVRGPEPMTKPGRAPCDRLQAGTGKALRFLRGVIRRQETASQPHGGVGWLLTYRVVMWPPAPYRRRGRACTRNRCEPVRRSRMRRGASGLAGEALQSEAPALRLPPALHCRPGMTGRACRSLGAGQTGCASSDDLVSRSSAGTIAASVPGGNVRDRSRTSGSEDHALACGRLWSGLACRSPGHRLRPVPVRAAAVQHLQPRHARHAGAGPDDRPRAQAAARDAAGGLRDVRRGDRQRVRLLRPRHAARPSGRCSLAPPLPR